MKDIIIDALGALAASIIGYVSLKKNKKWLIPKLTDKKVRELKTVAITETNALTAEPAVTENLSPADARPDMQSDIQADMQADLQIATATTKTE